MFDCTMKAITDYFLLKNSKNAAEKVTATDNVESEEGFYYVNRVIKIRAGDPNVPDSLVCEMYDSSPEEAANEHVHTTATETLSKENSPKNAESVKLRRRCKSRSKVAAPKCNDSTDDDEALVSVRKRLRASSRRGGGKGALTHPKPDNVLRQPNIKTAVKKTAKRGKIEDYFVTNTDSKDGSDLGKRTNLPLAPVFQMAARKQKEDPEVLKARRNFLHSGLPKKMRMTTVNMKKIEDEIESQFFPEISHVPQNSGDNRMWVKRPVDLKLKDLNEYEACPLTWKHVLKISPKLTISATIPSKIISPKIDVQKLKAAYKTVDIEALYKALKKNYETREEFLVWTEKYQPTSCDVLPKDAAVRKLKLWLWSWKCYGEFHSENVKGKDSSNDPVSSGDEGTTRNFPPTACLLQGPVGCGKSAIVRTIATEMDIHILEINSSSKRSGKKMLADLQEATKSHKILQESGGTFTKGEAMSVIVVEEADIVFDQDEGFVSGLQTLIATTKRPVLMLTNDSSVQHLQRFCTYETLQLKMSQPQLSWSCALLELIALIEGVCPLRSYLTTLLNKNKCDLRKSILELEFWAKKPEVPWDSLSCQPLNSDKFWWSEKTGTQIQPKTFFNYCDNLSVYDVLRGRTFSNEFYPERVLIRDGCCLHESTTGADKMITLREEIKSEIIRISCSKIDTSKTTNAIPLKIRSNKMKQDRATSELLQLVPNMSTRRELYIDYLPILRNISRAEQERQQGNLKRGNRFYHYLKLLGIKPTENNLYINCKALKAPLD